LIIWLIPHPLKHQPIKAAEDVDLDEEVEEEEEDVAEAEVIVEAMKVAVVEEEEAQDPRDVVVAEVVRRKKELGFPLPSLEDSSRRSLLRSWKRSTCSPYPSRNTRSSIGSLAPS
jgi:hypothetical protein